MRGMKNTYAGVDKDSDGGMTAAGRLIRDVWGFGIIPETGTCAGWDASLDHND